MTQRRYWERLISRVAEKSAARAVRASERNTAETAGGRAVARSLPVHAKALLQFSHLPAAVGWKVTARGCSAADDQQWGPPLWKENGGWTLPRGRRRGCAFQLLSSSSWYLYIRPPSAVIHECVTVNSLFQLVCCSRQGKTTTRWKKTNILGRFSLWGQFRRRSDSKVLEVELKAHLSHNYVDASWLLRLFINISF